MVSLFLPLPLSLSLSKHHYRILIKSSFRFAMGTRGLFEGNIPSLNKGNIRLTLSRKLLSAMVFSMLDTKDTILLQEKHKWCTGGSGRTAKLILCITYWSLVFPDAQASYIDSDFSNCSSIMLKCYP